MYSTETIQWVVQSSYWMVYHRPWIQTLKASALSRAARKEWWPLLFVSGIRNSFSLQLVSSTSTFTRYKKKKKNKEKKKRKKKLKGNEKP